MSSGKFFMLIEDENQLPNIIKLFKDERELSVTMVGLSVRFILVSVLTTRISHSYMFLSIKEIEQGLVGSESE
jgi:hypothetical protein